MINWNLYPNFTWKELDDGGPEPHPDFMRRLQIARSIAAQLCSDLSIPEIVFNLTSGSRSKENNQRVGGKDDSTHLYGRAVDIQAVTSRHRFIIIKSLILAGFTRIGISGDGNFIHVDDGENIEELNKAPHVLWLY